MGLRRALYIRGGSLVPPLARHADTPEKGRRQSSRDQRHQHQQRKHDGREDAEIETDVEDDELDEPTRVEQNAKRPGLSPAEADDSSGDRRPGLGNIIYGAVFLTFADTRAQKDACLLRWAGTVEVLAADPRLVL